MVRKLIQTICVLSLMFCVSCSSASVEPNGLKSEKTEPNKVDVILEKLNAKTQALKTYQCQIEYRHVQPSVFDTQTLRKGVLYYSKKEKSSNLRVNFTTSQQDEEQERKYNEQYIIVDGAALPKTDGRYEGLWLVQLDYEIKSAKYIQIAEAGEPNKPVDVFELVSKKFPIVGFAQADQLKEEFEITIPAKKKDSSDDLIHVQLKVKPNSVYKDNYVQIDCWIDEKQNLPVEIHAISTEPEGESAENKDHYDIKFLKAQVNEKIDKKVFDFQIPKDFDEPEFYPLDN